VDPKKDRGLYGFGASIYKRLLLNRRQFRLDRQQYEFSANGYGGLMQLIVEKTYNTQRQKLGKINFDEIEFIINDTVALLLEYLTSNPNDERVKKAVSLLQIQKSKYKPDEDNFEFKKQIIGETKCQNQLVIRANSRKELLNTITELSDILLKPFHQTPTQEAFQQEQYNEMSSYIRVRTTKNIILQKNSMPTSETYCLVGDEKISPIAWIYNALGMEQTATRNIQKALEYFEKALNHSPDYSFATYNIATCYAMLGNFEAALPHFEKAAKYYPYDNDIQNDLMYCKQQTGNTVTSQRGNYANQRTGCLFTILGFIVIGLTTFLLLL
jgi:tetratricopeptide (TPR) repeat protein